MSDREIPSPELLRQLLRYEPETGKLFWRERPVSMFSSERHCKTWNTKYANREAFTRTDPYGYKVSSILDHPYRAHKIIWAIVHGVWPADEMDYITGNKSDTRLSNLQEASHQENSKNTKRRSDNISGVAGVGWHSQTKMWRARVKVNGKEVYLGLFATVEEAAAVRQRAAARNGFSKHHGRDE